MRQDEEAIADSSRLLELEPNHADAYQRPGIAYANESAPAGSC